MSDIRYVTPNLYPKQREAIYDEARIVCIEASVGSGKTVGCLAWLFEQAWTTGRPLANYWWIAPVFGQAQIGYRRSTHNLRQLGNSCKFNQTTLTITLPNEAQVSFKSGERWNDLHGEDVHAAVLDEASRMREEAWHAVRANLAKTKGPARIIGNVKGKKNWFYNLARIAESGSDEEMAYHRITAWDAADAGVLDRREIERARANYEQLGRGGIWEQLFMAEAQDGGENPFGIEAIRRCVQPLSANPTTVAGVDLAGRGAVNLTDVRARDLVERDYTAIVLLDKHGCATYVDRFKASHTNTEQKIVDIVGRTMALVDSTGTGDAIVERLQRRGDMRVEGYVFNERSRQDLLEHLALMIGEEAVHFPDGTLRAELDSFEFGYSSRGERWSVPSGMKDDLVFALALAAKKLPWRRRVTAVPVGLPSPAGSRWLGTAVDRAAYSYLQDADPLLSPPGDDPVPVMEGGPLIVAPSRGSLWDGADR